MVDVWTEIAQLDRHPQRFTGQLVSNGSRGELVVPSVLRRETHQGAEELVRLRSPKVPQLRQGAQTPEPGLSGDPLLPDRSSDALRELVRRHVEMVDRPHHQVLP